MRFFFIFKKKNMKIIVCLLIIAFTQISNAQQPVNLIPNPSFELKNSCPTRISSSPSDFNNKVISWQAEYYSRENLNALKNSPDYYNACAPYNESNPNSTNNVGVPFNISGNQLAHSGNGYIGMIFGLGSPNNPYYEYVFTPLITPLIAGEEYTFSMFVSLAENSSSDAINKVGAVFVETLPFWNQHITTSLMLNSNLTPQVYATEVINDSQGWQEIRGSFFATGGEQYVILGVFENISEFQFEGIVNEYIPGRSFNSYYYIDDVSLFKGKILSNEEFNETQIKIYPNPTNDFVSLEGISQEELKTIELFDVKGAKLEVAIKNLKIDLSKLSTGTYFLKITNKENQTHTKKIIKN